MDTCHAEVNVVLEVVARLGLQHSFVMVTLASLTEDVPLRLHGSYSNLVPKKTSSVNIRAIFIIVYHGGVN